MEALRRGRIALQLVRRDLDLVAIGIAKIDRVRNLVILEFEWDRAFLQLILGTRKVFAIGPKSEMQRSHRGPVSRSRSDLFGCGK